VSKRVVEGITLSPMCAEVYDALEERWRSLRQITEAMGRVLSGSGYQICADYLVESGLAERRAESRAPMGVVYRKRQQRREAP
jgi:hypothetical protein